VLVSNYGYHGSALMEEVREQGAIAVEARILTDYSEFLSALYRLRELNR